MREEKEIQGHSNAHCIVEQEGGETLPCISALMRVKDEMGRGGVNDPLSLSLSPHFPVKLISLPRFSNGVARGQKTHPVSLGLDLPDGWAPIIQLLSIFTKVLFI